MKKRGKLDAIRGSLIGGAVGDALGYAIEFWQEDQIFHTYGSDGITEYALVDGRAQISDDTQMTLFTAAGILVGDTRMSMNGNGDMNCTPCQGHFRFLVSLFSDKGFRAYPPQRIGDLSVTSIIDAGFIVRPMK